MRGLTAYGAWAVVLVLCATVMAGCSDDPVKPIGRNSPPQTIAFLPENPDTSLYRQALSWWGEDMDGEVTHYLFRFLYDSAEWRAGDTSWVTTTATESTFYLPVSNELAVHTFEVTAVDDDGAEDPTPARINLIVRNSQPEVSFEDLARLPDTTLTAITFFWTGKDTVDGNDTITEYLIWLDGQAAPYSLDNLVSHYTFGRDDLRGGDGRTRTVYLQAVDSGCDSSEIATYSWYVKQPTGRILLIDNVPGSLVGASRSDEFYRDVLDSLALLGEPYTLLDFERHGGFTTAEDVFPALEPFEAVIWYTGTDSLPSDLMVRAEQGIRQYLDFGGSIMLSSMATVGAFGAQGVFTEEFAAQYLGVREFYLDVAANIPDSNFDLQKGWFVEPAGDAGLDTLKVSKPQIWVENFAGVPGAESLYRVEMGRYTESGQDNDWSVAQLYETPSGGQAAYFSFLLERSDGLYNARPQLAKVLNRLLE
ncbi:MAG: hypothetical protein KAW17_02810 [Candidatus Eisenbacteria sp.]|nr:hypothetical protein [Candidatus Eisenbacteria bacterium]